MTNGGVGWGTLVCREKLFVFVAHRLLHKIEIACCLEEKRAAGMSERVAGDALFF